MLKVVALNQVSESCEKRKQIWVFYIFCYIKYWTFLLLQSFCTSSRERTILTDVLSLIQPSFLNAWKITSKMVYAFFKYLFKFNRVNVYNVVQALAFARKWSEPRFRTFFLYLSSMCFQIAKNHILYLAPRFCLHNQLKFISLLVYALP